MSVWEYRVETIRLTYTLVVIAWFAGATSAGTS
jgi:hypothetical protein